MNSDTKLKGNNIRNCTCYYFDDIININDCNLDDILIDKKCFNL